MPAYRAGLRVMTSPKELDLYAENTSSNRNGSLLSPPMAVHDKAHYKRVKKVNMQEGSPPSRRGSVEGDGASPLQGAGKHVGDPGSRRDGSAEGSMKQGGSFRRPRRRKSSPKEGESSPDLKGAPAKSKKPIIGLKQATQLIINSRAGVMNFVDQGHFDPFKEQGDMSLAEVQREGRGISLLTIATRSFPGQPFVSYSPLSYFDILLRVRR